MTTLERIVGWRFPLARRKIRAAESDILIDRDVVTVFCGFADHAEPVVEEEVPANLCAGMDIDCGQEAREVIDQAGNKIKPSLPEPMRDPMKSKGPTPG